MNNLNASCLMWVIDLTWIQKFNHQYESVAKFKAHDGRILASAFTDFDGRPMYVTGGSDKTIAVWDVTDCVHDPSKPKRTSNGEYNYLRCQPINVVC